LPTSQEDKLHDQGYRTKTEKEQQVLKYIPMQ